MTDSTHATLLSFLDSTFPGGWVLPTLGCLVTSWVTSSVSLSNDSPQILQVLGFC